MTPAKPKLGDIVTLDGRRFRVAHITEPLTVTTPRGRLHTHGHMGLAPYVDRSDEGMPPLEDLS